MKNLSYGLLAILLIYFKGYGLKTKKDHKQDSVALTQVMSKLQSMEQEIHALRILLKAESQSSESPSSVKETPSSLGDMGSPPSFLMTLHRFLTGIVSLVNQKIHQTAQDAKNVWKLGTSLFDFVSLRHALWTQDSWFYVLTTSLFVLFYGFITQMIAGSLTIKKLLNNIFVFTQKNNIHFSILLSSILFLFFIHFSFIEHLFFLCNQDCDWLWKTGIFLISSHFFIHIFSHLLFFPHGNQIALIPFAKNTIQKIRFWFQWMMAGFSFWMAIYPIRQFTPTQTTLMDLWLLGIAFSWNRILKTLCVTSDTVHPDFIPHLKIRPLFLNFLIWFSHIFFFLLWLNSSRDINLLFFFFTYVFLFPLGSLGAHKLRFYRLIALKESHLIKSHTLWYSILFLFKQHRWLNQGLFWLIQTLLLMMSAYIWDFHRFVSSFFRIETLGFHPLTVLKSFIFGKCLDIGTLFLGAYGLTYVSSKIIPLFFHKNLYSKTSEQSHVIRRLKILSSIFQGIAKVFIWIPAIGMSMTVLGYEMRPLLASLGFLSVGLAFGLQTFIRDFITGFFIIFENSLMIGDEVDIDGHCGKVEDLSLRIVRIRKDDGSLFTFPLSSIVKIGNKNRFFSYAVFTVSVDLKENVDRIKGLMENAAMRLRRSDIAPLLLAPLEYQGLINVTDYSLVIQGRLRTAPGQQDKVHRAYTRMLKMVFDEVGIRIPTPPSSASWKAPSLTKTSLNGQ